MSRYRRIFSPGGTFSFTVVANRRRPLFLNEFARNCLRLAWNDTAEKRPFENIALCLMPDHIHCVWRLPEEDVDYSGRWSSIKSGFSRRFMAEGVAKERNGFRNTQTASGRNKRESGLWQRRFWLHVVTDDLDLERHVNYVHYNPVKHEFVSAAADWQWSTFHRYVREGIYHQDWGRKSEGICYDVDDAGE